MRNMNENRNLISMRQRRLIRQLNREIEQKRERRSAARKVFGAILTACLVIICALVMVCAAEIQAAEEAQAAVLRDLRINPDIKASYPHSPNAGLEASDPWMVESLPDVPPDHGEPPEAIEIIAKDAAAAETIPEERWESLGEFTLTFYCACRKCSDGWGHQTASGATAVEGVTVAVDPRVIPYGTRLKIGGREYIAQDCGGSIKGRKIDIFKESHAECLENGIQKAEVMIKR